MAEKRRVFILETDWGSDCDDAVAIRLLNNAHKKGEILLAGIDVNSCCPHSIASLDIFLKDGGIEEIPLGLDLSAGDFDFPPAYQDFLLERGTPSRQNKDAFPSLPFYRKLLSSVEDGECEILSIGFPQVLAGLLEEEELKELLHKKVKHLWIMGGKWDEEGGKEYNFSKNKRIARSAHFLCAHWPSSITFLGWEVGHSVLTGKELPQEDLLKGLMCVHGSPNGRSSWDPMLVSLALAESPEKAGYKCIYGKASVDKETGENFFSTMENGPHRFVVKLREDPFYEKTIEARLSL